MTRKTTIPIYDGDDFERMGELRREVTIAERNAEASRGAAARVGDDAPAALQQAKDAFDAFVDEAAERAEMWVLHPLGHEEFRRLLKEHPPRKVPKKVAPPGEGEPTPAPELVTDPDDEFFGVNTETFPKALLLFVDPEDDEHRTVVEPAFDSEAALRKRIRRLSAGEFDSIWVAALMLNNGGLNDPKAETFSTAAQRSLET